MNTLYHSSKYYEMWMFTYLTQYQNKYKAAIKYATSKTSQALRQLVAGTEVAQTLR